MNNHRSVSLLLFSLIFFTALTPAQPQYQKFFGGDGNDIGLSICRGVDGGYLIAGQTTSGGAGAEDICLVKVTSAGEIEWAKTYGGSGMEVTLFVMIAPDSSYLVVGRTNSGLSTPDILVLRVASNGDIIWSKLYGGLGEENGASALVHPDGGFLIVGSGGSFSSGPWDGWLIRINDDGSVLWFKTYGAGQTEAFTVAAPTKDGGYVITGHSYTFGAGSHDAMLIKITGDGTVQWMRTYGTYADETGYLVRETPDGGFLLTMISAYGFVGGLDCIMLRTDSAGTILSTKVYGSQGDDELQRGGVLDSNRMMLAGYTIQPAGTMDGWFAIVDLDGTFESSWLYDGGGHERMFGVTRDPSGPFVLAGMTNQGSVAPDNLFLVRTDAEGGMSAGAYPGPGYHQAATLQVSSPLITDSSMSLVARPGPSEVHELSLVSGDLLDVALPAIFVPPTFGRSSDTVSVAVKLTKPYGLAGGDLRIALDTSMLVPVNVRKGPLMADFALAFNLSQPDSILVSFARATGLTQTTEGVLFYVDCAVHPGLADSLSSQVTLAGVQLYDEEANPFPVDVVHGTFTTFAGRKGDVNTDQHVNAADAILCLRIAASFDSAGDHRRWAADYDGDGDVTAFDATGILRESVGLSPIPFEGDAERVVIVRVPPISANSGAEVKAPVSILGFPDMMSGTIDFAVDPDLLEAQSVSTKPLFEGVLAFGTPQSGMVRVAFASSESWDQQDAVLAEMAFVAKANVVAFTPNITSAKFFDKFGRVSSTFQLITTGLEDDKSIPATLLLEQNYPNPFNPVTTIDFSLPATDRVVLSVFDVLGRKVRTLIDEEMSAGPHTIRFDGASLPSGVYFYTLTSGTATARRSMLLLK